MVMGKTDPVMKETRPKPSPQSLEKASRHLSDITGEGGEMPATMAQFPGLRARTSRTERLRGACGVASPRNIQALNTG